MEFWSDDEDNEKMSRSWSSTSDDSFNCDMSGGHRRRLGHLYFEFFEVGSPYGRVPLIDKVNLYCLHAILSRFFYGLLFLCLFRYMIYLKASLG
jgi:hypothetical protein